MEMKKLIIILISLIATICSYGQLTSPLNGDEISITYIERISSKFTKNMPVNKIVYLADSNKLYKLTRYMSIGLRMQDVFNLGTYVALESNFVHGESYFIDTVNNQNKHGLLHLYDDLQVDSIVSASQCFTSDSVYARKVVGGTYMSTDSIYVRRINGAFYDTVFLSLDRDTSTTGTIPANYMLEYIVVDNSSANTAALSISVNGDLIVTNATFTTGTISNIFIGTVYSNVSDSDFSIGEVNVADNWNNARLNVNLIFRRIY